VFRRVGIWAAPIVERSGRKGDQRIDAGLPTVILLLVYRATVQTQDPGLNVALRDQVNDRFAVTTCLLFSLLEGYTELPDAPFDAIGVGIDDNRERGVGTRGSRATRLNQLRVLISDPFLPAASVIG